MTERVGFFEEESGSYSMARLCAFICIVAGGLVVGAMAIALALFASRGTPVPDGVTEFGGMAVGALVATFGGAWASLSQRKKSGDEVATPAPSSVEIAADTVTVQQ